MKLLFATNSSGSDPVEVDPPLPPSGHFYGGPRFLSALREEGLTEENFTQTGHGWLLPEGKVSKYVDLTE